VIESILAVVASTEKDRLRKRMGVRAELGKVLYLRKLYRCR
jgi:hypothetical protein